MGAMFAAGARHNRPLYEVLSKAAFVPPATRTTDGTTCMSWLTRNP
jgi:hypothetical protein